MRRREGLAWLMGKERVDVAGIAIAPAPPVAPVGPSEHPALPEGDSSPSCGVTLRKKDQDTEKLSWKPWDIHMDLAVFIRSLLRTQYL